MTDRPIQDPAAFLDELCRRHFPAFVRKAWPILNGGSPIAWNWHLDSLSYQLHRVFTGDCLRLIINLPPRNGKSMLTSVLWIAWCLGRDSTLRFVCVSYANELSAKLARDCIALMQSDLYRALFPGTRLSPRRSASYDFETTRGGGRLATSITGTLTGRGGDIIVLDDLLKADEAHSDVARTRVNQWFKSTLASRHDDKRKGPIILVMQRLHEDDLSGHLIESGGWEHLCLRAVATQDELYQLGRGRSHYRREGDVLHPEREPIEVLDGIKRLMGSAPFSAQYQQEPVPAQGNIVRAEWLRTFNLAELELRPGQIAQSWDTAGKDSPHSDYSVCVTALIRRKDIYIIDVFRDRLTFPQLKRQAIRLAQKHCPNVLLIEDASSGTQLLQTLRAESHDGVPSPTRRKPEGDKLARVDAIASMIESGEVFFPAEAPWLAEFTSELLGFPNARHDDQVDALTQLLTWKRDRDRWSSATATGLPIIVTA